MLSRCIITLMPGHFRVLCPCNTVFLFSLRGWGLIGGNFRVVVGREAKVKLTWINFFIGMKTTHIYLALQYLGRSYDLACIKCSSIFPNVICLFFRILALFSFKFSCLLGRCFWSVVSNFISEEYFWTVNFFTLNKWICEYVGARWVPTMAICFRITRVDVATMADSYVGAQHVVVHWALRPLRRKRGWKVWCLHLLRVWVRHLLFILQTFEIYKTCHY